MVLQVPVKVGNQVIESNNFNEEILDLYAEHIIKKHPDLRSIGNLYLGNLRDLSDAAAESLSRHEGHLSLDGLTSLSDSANHIALAKKLASQNGPLYLSELTSLSDGAAEALSKCDGDFDLKGLKSLSDTGAQALAKKKGGKNKMRLPLQIQNQVDKYKKK